MVLIVVFVTLLDQVRVNQRYQENVSMRHSVLVSNAISNIKKDVLSQPLQLLSGVDILGNASSALGHMSKGVAALSMDKKFIQSRQRQVLSCLFWLFSVILTARSLSLLIKLLHS